MAKLWQKDYGLDSLMQRFTVRDDYKLDMDLVISDVYGSAAHARDLERIGVLTKDELSKLEEGLALVAEKWREGGFVIREEDEDCHTAIEGLLTAEYGDVGKKIHTGRSRNDQVQTALRVYMREAALRIAVEAGRFASELLDAASKWEFTPMPGRTHTQLAMPSSLGLWFDSFAEEILDETEHLLFVAHTLDQCPLGSAASYGAPLPLDREFTASELGFSRPQPNVLYANNSRGKFESMLLDACGYLTSTAAKMAQDLMLFTLPELGYFSLPRELTTGSSIMPQKKNPDGLELVRSRASLVASDSTAVKDITRNLVSGYNRDFQDTKAPLLDGLRATFEVLAVMARMVEGLEVHPDKLLSGMRPEIFATDKVFDMVKAGGNFRDSYRQVGLNLDQVSAGDAEAAVRSRVSTGTTGNLPLDEDKKKAQDILGRAEGALERLGEVCAKLVPGAGPAVNW